MIKIRNNIFETNSSSTHSLVVSKIPRSYDYNLPVDSDGILNIRFGEYGWGPQVLNTPIEKLSYIITDRGPGAYADGFDIEILEQNEEIQKIIEVVKNACPEVKEVKFEMNDSFYPYGYIDHESEGTSYEEENLEYLIFSNQVIIIIDNDNSNHFQDYFYNNWTKQEPKKDIEKLFR